MTSFLEVDAADERHVRLASRKAVVLAQTRAEQRFGKFVTSTEALAFVNDDLAAIAREASEEIGYDDPSKVYTSLWDYFESRLDDFKPKTASVHESRKPKMCPFHRDVVDISLAEGSAKAGFDAMAQHWGGPRHCDGEGYEGDKCNFKPQMVTQAFWDERAEKAEERKQQRAEQAELEAQQGDEITEPEAEGDVIIEEPSATETIETEPEGAEVIDFPVGDASEAPVAEEVPMSMAASTKESDYKYVKQRGDKWVITQKGTGKVLSTHDSEEQAKSAFRAMETNMHGSKTADDTTGLGGPIPTIDKRKWTPQTVPFLDVDEDDGNNPTRHKDIVETIKPSNGDELKEIGAQVTERQNVDKEVDYAKTDGQSATWSDGPKTAISAADDIHKNPITELVREGYDGFLPEATVQQAIAASRK